MNVNDTDKIEIHRCRTCYNATKGLKPLTNLTKCGVGGEQQQKSFAQLLNEISCIDLMDDLNKELPQCICDGCIRKLKMAHTFVQQAQDINTRLLKMVLNRTEAYKESDCLREAEVDAQSFLGIKVEPMEEDEPEEQSIVEIKREEMEADKSRDVSSLFLNGERLTYKMPRKKFKIEKFVSYDEFSNKSTCLVETCKKVLCGKLKSNIIRHYKLVHKQDIKSDDESDSEDISICKKRKQTIKLSSNMEKNDFLKCCLGLVTKKNLPFRIFDDQEYFKQLIAPYEQVFNINLNSKNIATILEKANNHIKSEITSLVKNKMICLKIDIASRMERNVLGINIQYIKDYKICVNTIGMVQAKKRFTTANLREEILKCLQEYNIGMQQIYSSTTHNGANILKLSKILKETKQENMENEMEAIDVSGTDQIQLNLESVFSSVPCVAHTIHLAAYDVIKTLENDIEECRKITKKLRTSVRSIDDRISLPNLDVVTRWNSTYKMIENILSNKEFIENLDSFNNFHINWIFIQNFVKAFAPLAKCSLKLQTEQYILGDFFRDWLTCELELEELVSINTLAASLLNAMRNRKEQLLQHDAFAAALYLDPRFNFNGTPFLTNDLKQNSMDHLLKVFEMANKLINSPNDHEFINASNSSSCSSQDDIPTSTTNAYNKLDLHVRSLMNAKKVSFQRHTANIKHKLLRLCEVERVCFATNVLEYWRKSCSRDNDMMQLVEIVLAAPATQVSVERSFSALSTMLAKFTSKLSKKSLSNLLIVKFNYELLNFSNFAINEDHIIASSIN